MATTVHYRNKNGTPGKATFPTRDLAERYARTLQGGVWFEETTAPTRAVTVTTCPTATAEVQKAATNAYYRSVKEPARGTVTIVKPEDDRPTYDADQWAEMKAEHFFEAAITGQSMADAWDDWDYRCQGRGDY